ncbi:hypothetical protein FALBO_6652 [Fusarium albosuccineum]|uniref:6-phosphogluconolactonase n=1 Tax=Fusarium albosuccineum TaxID=1237068 RepID=A0A8H4PD69_9HYPO|nr:hypothetical protein FALBO_6652 [Fusarium albosuccineum]
MNFNFFSIAIFLMAAVSATSAHIRRAAESYSEGRILLGGPDYIYISRWIPEAESRFGIRLERQVSALVSWMAFAPPDRLYVADQSSTLLRLYEINLEDDMINVKQETEASSGVVHLEFNKDKTRLFASAYDSGAVDIWNIEGNTLNLMKTVTTLKEHSEVASHPHQANLDPTGRFLVVNDGGTDSIIIIDTKDDVYNIKGSVDITPSGCGPHHGVFYPQGTDKATAYIVVCEESSDVLVYSVVYDVDQLILTHIQTERTFSDDSPPANKSTTSAGGIALMPDNQNLYVSNRMMGNETDYISFFRIDIVNSSLPMLSLSGIFPAHGIYPNMISPSMDGRWLFTANQDGGNAGAFATKVNIDGTLRDGPDVGIWFYLFGEKGSGPRFIEQIR